MDSSQDSRPSAGAPKSRCLTAVRVPLFMLNLVTWICGGGLIGLGIWVVATDNDYKHFTENKNMFIVYITLGAFLFTAGFFGLCGAVAGNKVLLKLYFTMVCLVFCGLFGLIVFALIQKNVVTDIVKDSWNKTSDETRIFIQDKFECCGISDVTYNHPSDIDKSCFVNFVNTTTDEVKQNCLSKLVDWFKEHQLTISLFGSSIMVLMVALMVSSCYVLHQLGARKIEIKRNRVVPITVDQNDGTLMTNFTEERPKKERRRQSDMQDVAANEEADEGIYSSRENDKQPRKGRGHKSNKRQSWAKHDTMLA